MRDHMKLLYEREIQAHSDQVAEETCQCVIRAQSVVSIVLVSYQIEFRFCKYLHKASRILSESFFIKIDEKQIQAVMSLFTLVVLVLVPTEVHNFSLNNDLG